MRYWQQIGNKITNYHYMPQLIWIVILFQFNSEDDEKQNLLVKHASVMGMLQNLEMNSDEAQKLEEELHDIEGRLKEISKG